MSSVLAECVGIQQLGSAMGLAVMQMNLAVSLASTSAGNDSFSTFYSSDILSISMF